MKSRASFWFIGAFCQSSGCLAASVARVAARARYLNRRARHRSIRTEHAAIAGLRPEQDTARAAFEEEDAGIGRHRLRMTGATSRTSELARHDRCERLDARIHREALFDS
jgi:hypothetical protein